MTDRKTLGLRGPSDEAPELPKKGRGGKISDKRLDALHDRAREMRRFASPANKALAKKFAEADLGRYTSNALPSLAALLSTTIATIWAWRS